MTMKARFLMLIGAAGLLLTGCVTNSGPNKEVIAGLNYGDPITIDYQEVIKKDFDRVSKTPVATLYKFNDPVKYWYRDPALLGGTVITGYAVKVQVDARNSLGGDTGYQPYIFIFHNNVIVKVLTPDDLRAMKLY